MKVIFTTNLPSPYRVDFFNELGKSCDLTVVYERTSSAERDTKWKGSSAVNFKEVYLNLQNSGVDLAKGSALKDYIKSHEADFLFFTNYSSPATREAIIWCRLHGRKYYMEYDGGFNKRDSFLKRIVKKFLLKGASGHLTTADEHINYLLSLGIKPEFIFKYPFTSVAKKDIEKISTIISSGKQYFKSKLGISEQRMILTVGRFSYQKGYGKGYDILMELANRIGSNVGIYIVGDNPTDEFVEWKQNKQLENIHFSGFKSKDELKDYYAASDLFILLSRGDIWGLVINEAMAYGLPVITSDRCVAGLELIKNGVNGYLVNLNNQDEIVKSINTILNNNPLREQMETNNKVVIENYTIEKMSEYHSSFFNGNH